MQNDIQLTTQFENHPINVIQYKDQPVWIAHEVGAALGYEGTGFITLIGRNWADELIEGQDYVKVHGSELSDLKALLGPLDDLSTGDPDHSTGFVASRSSHVILLTETGINLCLMLTRKEAGRRLRRFLAAEVLPQLRRDNAYLPGRTVENGQIVDGGGGDKLALAWARERRLTRQLESRALKGLVQTLRKSGRHDEPLLLAYEVCATEAATGRDLSALKPTVADNWASPTAIATRLGVSVQVVGQAITRLGLRGNREGWCRAIVNKAKGHDRTVTSYVYSHQAEQRIAAEVRRVGHAGCGSLLELPPLNVPPP